MIKYLGSILFVFLAHTLLGQWKDIELSEFSDMILTVEKKIPDNTSFSYKAKYDFYEFLDSKEPKLKLDFVLVYKAKTNELYMNQFGRETVQNKTIQVTCDTAVKMLIVNKAVPELIQKKTLDDFKLLLKSKCKASKFEKENETGYYLQFADGATYKAAELWIGKNGNVSKYILYTGKEFLDDSEKEDKMIRPRMEIHFSDYLVGDKVNDIKIKNWNDYFINIENKEVKEQYKDFELVDLRNNE